VKLTFSDHAIDRFCERYAPDLSHEEAEAHLASIVRHARFLRNGYRRQRIFLAQGIPLVVCDDVVITVLGEEKGRSAS
jgi:hypothetical protein